MTDRSRQDAGRSTMGDNGTGASESTPLDGGGFLLQLLQRAPQSQPPATSPNPIGGRSSYDGHYVDSAVAAVGPAYPFYSPNLSDVGRHQIPSFPLPHHLHQGPWPSSTPPSAFSPPRFSPPRFSPPGFSHSFPRGNQGSLLQNEGRHLRLSPGNFDSAELNRNPGRNVQQHQNQHIRQVDGFPVQSSESAIVFGSLTNNQPHEHVYGRKKSDFSGFPGQSHTKKMGDSGFEREGLLLSGLRGENTCSSDPNWVGQANDNSYTHTGEYAVHGRVTRPVYPGKQQQYDGSMKSSVATELSNPLSATNTQNGSGHCGFKNVRMLGERNEMITRHELQSKEDQHSAIHYMKRTVAQKQVHLDAEQERSAQSLENGRIYNQGSDFDEPIDAEAGMSKEQDHPEVVHECENGLEDDSFPSKFTPKQHTLLVEQGFDSLTLIEEHVEKSELKNVNSRRNKDARFDFSRGHNVSNHRMRYRRGAVKCRYDIRRLTTSFLTIYESLVPAEEEKAKQKQLLLSLEKLVNKEWPSSQLHVYGSCANSFGVSNSDIDICLEIDDSESSKPEILLKLAEILQSDNLQNVQALTHARVPIVKLMDPLTGISCDICINNLLAVVNTKLLRDYAKIDERLRQLAFIIKFWAKSRGVNETYQGTLSSYAYVLMCIHFLQTRRPPILPCLQIMEATYAVTVDDIDCAFFDQVEKLRDFGTHNKESIAELLWGFFNYWAFIHDYANAVISVRTGGLISKQEKDWTRRIGNDRHLICIEDPFEISHDLGRVVDKHSIRILREEFERAANILQFDHNPSTTLFEPYKRESSG